MSKIASSNEHVSFAARSDVGMKRPINQDAFDTDVADPSDWSVRGHRFLVADGMGAHAAGELASQLAVDEVRREYNQNSGEPRDAVVRSLRVANAHIHNRGQADPQLYNMGTTCSSLFLLPRGALVGHVGDSRVYRCRDTQIQQLTFDHSLVWEMRAAGQINADDSNSNIPRNVITRCLGPHADVEIDLEGYFSVRPNDTFLLCSDGLTGRITDEEIGVISRFLEPEEAVDFLVDLANLRGGSDNITVIITRVKSNQLAAAGEVNDFPRAQRSGTHPGWFLLAGVGLATALAGIQLSQFPVIGIGSFLFLASALGAGLQWSKQHQDGSTTKLPTSPYSTASAEADQEFVHGMIMTFDTVSNAFPELGVGKELSRIRDLVPEEDAVSSEDAKQICKDFARIASQLREKI